MSDDKPKPLDDLKEGLGLLFRAAKGAVEKLPTESIEHVAKDAAKEMTRAFETIGAELDKAFKTKPVAAPPSPDVPAEGAPGTSATPADPPVTASSADPTAVASPPLQPERPFDDAYAPEPPKGPRIG